MSMKKQSLWNMAPLIVSSAVGIFSMPLFYRYLGVHQYFFMQAVALLSGSFGFMDLGFGMAVGRYIGVALGRGDRSAIREYWATGNALALPLLAGMGALFIALGVIFGPQWFEQGALSPEDRALLPWCFVIGGLTLFLNYYAQFWNVVSQAHLDFKFISILKTGTALAQVVPALFLARLTHDALVVLLWTAAIALLQVLLYAWHSKANYGLGFSFGEASWVRLREMATFTGKTFIGLLVSSVMSTIDRFTVGRFAPKETFTIYSNAITAAARLTNLGMAAMGPVYFHSAQAVGSGRRALGEIYEEMFSVVLEWYCFAATWILVWSSLLLTVWWRLAGKDQAVAEAMAPYFPIVCVAFCFSGISNVSVSQLGPLNRVGTEVLFVSALGVAIASGILIGWFSGGLVGVAYGLLASRSVLVCQDLYVARLVGAKGWLSLANWRRILVQVIVALVFVGLRWQFSPSTGVSIVLACLHGGSIGCWLAYPYWKKWRERDAHPAASGVETKA